MPRAGTGSGAALWVETPVGDEGSDTIGPDGRKGVEDCIAAAKKHRIGDRETLVRPPVRGVSPFLIRSGLGYDSPQGQIAHW